MADPRGTFRLTCNGKEYRLHLGMSVLADLQAKHGSNVFQKLERPAGAGNDWIPDLAIVIDFFFAALQRHHGADDAALDRYLVDDMLAENPGAFAGMMAVAFPDQKAAPAGNGKRPKRAA